MEIEFDPDKEAANLAKHKISLARAVDLQTIAFERVERRGESRLKVMGFLDGELYAMVVVFRRNTVRIISLRRAREQELNNE